MEKNSTSSAIDEAATELTSPDDVKGTKGHERLGNLDVALGYAECGVAVRPSGMADQDPTTDPAVIRGWWDGEDDDVSVAMDGLVAIQVFKDGLSTLHLWEGAHGVLPKTHMLVDDNLDYPTVKLVYSVENPVEGFCESSVPLRVWGVGEAVAVTGRSLAAAAPIDEVPIAPADDTVMSLVAFLRDGTVAEGRNTDKSGWNRSAGSPRQRVTTVDIDKVVVSDRIRRDYGDLTELAEDIRSNTLLNPPVVTANDDGTFTLIAGERRLRAMRDVLGCRQTEVNVVKPRDAEQALRMEISENECRKDFTFTERLIYAEKIQAIQRAKARERQGARNDLVQNSAPSEDSGKTRDKVASAIGVSHDTLRKAQFISDNRDMLEPSDFADWDEGRLSTNKAFQRVKAAKRQADKERGQAERERDGAIRDLEDARRANEAMESEIASLKRQVAEKPKPEVVVREVKPSDYEATKQRVFDLERDNKACLESNKSLRSKLESARKELKEAGGKAGHGMGETVRDVGREVMYLANATDSYLCRYGGFRWTKQQLSEVDGPVLEHLTCVVERLAEFSSELVMSLDNASEV